VKSRYRNTGPPPEVVELVYERAQYACEIGGCLIGDRRGVDHHLHHRRPRRAGGDRRRETNTAPNLLLVCPDDHEFIESNRRLAYNAGWLLRHNDLPAEQPALIRVDGQLCWKGLSEDGRYLDCDVPEGVTDDLHKAVG
jgi:hypothetical protein